MSDRPIPVYVDTRKIFQQQGEIAGPVPLARLTRFQDSLASDQGFVRVELQFFTNDSGLHVISGQLRAEVQVICQRCLEPLGIVLEDDIRLVVLQDEARAATLDAGFDPWICADTKLDLASLVEEQLMLCMPIVNLHETSLCGDKLAYTPPAEMQSQAQAGSPESPFAVLKALKENDGTH